MDVALSRRKTKAKEGRRSVATVAPQKTSQYAVEEINAYIAVRDGLLEEAEAAPTEAGLERLVSANSFVANCLRPTRKHYLTQYLADIDAVRELKQCHAVDTRIAKVRAILVCAA